MRTIDFIIGVLFTAFLVAVVPVQTQDRLPVIDCHQSRGKAGVIVKNYEGKVFRVDVCAVAESPEGEDFRYAQ